MIVYLLVTITTWSFGGHYPRHDARLVDSPESAAIDIWFWREQEKGQAEPDQVTFRLLAINLVTLGIAEVPIPDITFVTRSTQ